MPFKKGLVIAAGLAALFAASEASAASKWAIGGVVDLNSPQRKMKDRYGNVSKFSGAFSYVRSEALTLSVEYSRAKFDHGKLETLPFVWSVDNKKYTSPKASSTMKLNTYSINATIYPGKANQEGGFKAGNYRWFVLIGGGYTDYKQVNQNFVYPGQSGGVAKVLDFNLVMDPQIDKRVALQANFGAGVEGFISNNWAVDVRVRYNVIVGEIRSLLLWNMQRVWPIQFLDLGAGMKFYFGR